VINTINNGKERYKSQLNLMLGFFTGTSPVIVPQQYPNLYKFKINETVRINLSKAVRKQLGFKFSLFYGKKELFDVLENFLRNLFLRSIGQNYGNYQSPSPHENCS
jgi:hypothetical protein